MLQSWYQKTAKSLVNTLVLFSWHNRLPYQQYDLLKKPLILALSAYNSKTNSVTPIFYYRIVIGMIRCNFLQSLKYSAKGVQNQLFENLRWLWTPFAEFFTGEVSWTYPQIGTFFRWSHPFSSSLNSLFWHSLVDPTKERRFSRIILSLVVLKLGCLTWWQSFIF